MKFDLFRSAVIASLLTGALSAAPLTRPTPVHVGASDDTAVITILKPGAELTLATMVTAPAGWTAVSLPGPHETYVQNTYIQKDLTIKPDAPLYSAPDTTATRMTTSVDNDPIEITGLRGRWTQLRLNRAITGYVRSATPAVATTPPPAPRPSAIQSSPVSDAPARTWTGTVPGGSAGSSVNPTPAATTGSLGALPRLFEGKVVSTRSPFHPRRPYDYALVNEGGTRMAYLDFSKLMQLSQIEGYTDRDVTAYGPVEAVPGTNDIVVRVESLRLR